MIEPGRSLVGNAGVCVTEVLYLKPGEQKNFCIVDAAMNDLPRPGDVRGLPRIVPVTRAERRPTYDVVGPVCESGDWIGRDRKLAAQPGDLLAVLSAGAYCMSMASNYNTRGRAAEVLVDGEQAHLIRERETSRQMRKEKLLPSGCAAPTRGPACCRSFTEAPAARRFFTNSPRATRAARPGSRHRPPLRRSCSCRAHPEEVQDAQPAIT
jgi:hypothetical protein